jgi:membrane fusion protein, multidrug efflux system
MGSAPPPPQAPRTPLDPARGGDGAGAVFSGGYGKQVPQSPAPSRARRKRNWLVPLLVLGGLGAGGAWLASHWGIEETDNAQLQGRLTEISSRVPGTIVRVFVDDNQEVKAGQPLILLDDRDAGVRLYRARADLEQVGREAEAMGSQAGATLSTARAAQGVAIAEQQSASSELARTWADAQRLVGLAQQGGVSRYEAERAVAAWRKAQADFTHSQASAQSVQARIQDVGVDRSKAQAAAAKVAQAQAALAEAQLQLSYTRITAPAPGRIGARRAEPGRQVQPGQPLMTLVDTQPWVEANFKETQLTALRLGQAAEVRLDAFPDRVFKGRITGLAPASGARFTLLPPDNASGNFTKVVQRITARIALDPQQTKGLRLVPGLSANVRVRR